MKVVLSIDAIRFPLTGIGRYTVELAQQLNSLPQIEKLHFLLGDQIVHELPVPMQSATNSPASYMANLRKAVLQRNIVAEISRLKSSLRTQITLSKYSDCIFHGPNYYLPKFSGPSVCTFHDLSIFTWAHCHPPERIRNMQNAITHTLKRAEMLITDSEYNRQELAFYFNWPLEKIRSIPLACAADFRPRTTDEVDLLVKKHGLFSGGYCLFVGTIEPRKNLDALLNAYSMLTPSVRKRWPLVLIGYHGWLSEQLHVLIESAIAEGWLRYLGFVEANELPIFFAGARLFVFPSLYEGFGLPVLEAMASGVPVVCSNASSLPEVTGNVAAMCDPKDVDMLSCLIQKGLEDDQWRGEAKRKGIEQAKKFSWRRCAEETVEVYREVST